MNIAAPMRLSTASRDPERTAAALRLLLALHSAGGHDLGVPDTKARTDLVADGLLVSYRPLRGRFSRWKLTPAGIEKALAAMARRG